MIQAIVKKGTVNAEDISAPNVTNGSVLIKVVNSCISAGTEMSGVLSSGKSIIKRALEQPAYVSKALDMIKSDGIVRAYKRVADKLQSSSPTGYSISGVVIGVGENSSRFKVGDEVAAAGAGLANHAEYVNVPENLVMSMPKGLGFVEASTVTLGGIAIQSVRRSSLAIGEYGVVVGAGILGLLALQILRHSGVRVIVVDVDDTRLKIAQELGAELIINSKDEDPTKTVSNFTGGYGADAVLFTAATSQSEPLSQSFQMCKKRGRVILVGVAGMEISREDMYAKELDFLMSTSYGPGRYDNNYELKGIDYPYAYVRWTENRNMEEYLRLVSVGAIRLEKLINQIFAIHDVKNAFESLKNLTRKPLMVVLDYGKPNMENLKAYLDQDRKISLNSVQVINDVINVGFVGIGDFALGMHLPNFEKLKNKYRIYATMNKTGLKAKTVAQQCQAKYATTDFRDIINDPQIDLVFITTRHDSHAELTLKALESGKNVFVEKPLATNLEEVEKIKAFYRAENGAGKPLLMVGFNRRFSRYAREIKKHTDKRINPLVIHYRMNAGYVPVDHWVFEQGGRIIGEACHVIDLMTYFTGANILSVNVESSSPKTAKYSSSDNKSIILKYDDGSICSIDYFSVGNRGLPKEMMEVHFDDKSIIMNDYKSLTGYGVRMSSVTTSVNNKGHFEELEVLYETLKKSDPWPIELWDMIQTTEVAINISKDVSIEDY